MSVALTLSATRVLASSDESASCESTLPPQLVAQLSKRYPQYRMPAVRDTEHSACVEEQRKRPCLLITQGDFDGDGHTDFALLLPSRQPKIPPKFVTALKRANSWSIEELKIGSDPFIGHFMLQTLRPGTYRDMDNRVITSANDGVALSACESWSSAHFRIDGKWVGVAMSD
jgi:hypothetical protein